MGCYFSIENLRFAFSWLYSPNHDLCDINVDVDFDQCMFGLAPPHVCDPPFPPTPTSTNLPFPTSKPSQRNLPIQSGDLCKPLHSPSCLRIKKPIRIRTNLCSLTSLARKCDGTHVHYPCYGSAQTGSGWQGVARAAGAYPPGLCKPWAAAVKKGLEKLDCPLNPHKASLAKPQSFK